MPELTRVPASDFHFVACTDPEDGVAKVLRLVTERIPARFALDPVRDVQVLCPMTRGGLGARALNIELQRAPDPPGELRVERFGWSYAVGDKVMQTDNAYDKEVYNGDLGFITRIDPDAAEVAIAFNGRTLRRIVLDFADTLDPMLARWIEAEVAFPSSMVDRIVPATTDDDRRAVAELLGVEDAWPVVTEPFRQWVVEDRFAGDRPALEDDGAIFVESVEPFERMKLRLLNGAHSAIAYLSVAAGVETVSDAMALPGMRGFLRALWAESGETLDLPAGYDLAGYTAALVPRTRARPAWSTARWWRPSWSGAASSTATLPVTCATRQRLG